MTMHNRAVLMIVTAGVFLSILGLGTRLMESANGLQIAFYRALGLLVFSTLTVMYLNKGRFLNSLVASGWTGFVAGVFLALASITVVLALVTTTAANAMFIISLTPLISGVLAWLIIGEKVRLKTWGTIGVALIGVFIIINGALSSNGLRGIAYAFLMAFCYGLFNVTLRRGKNQDMLPAICWSSYVLVVVLGLAVDDLAIPRSDLLICLSLGVFQIGLGGFLLIAGSKHVPAAQLALLAMLEVVLNPIWVWLGVGEVPATATLIGGLVILTAISYEAVSNKGVG
ncbi:MAG: DME family drug/metabolite transporter [Arenicella sp.]|jgi:DME family drug/metabolite transporter